MGGYRVSCIMMPRMPIMEVARPTVGAERPSPEGNVKGKAMGKEESDSVRAVERNKDHRLEKAPMWKSKNATVRRVKSTFLVKMRWKGRMWWGWRAGLGDSASGSVYVGWR